jgi:hypothetical protein
MATNGEGPVDSREGARGVEHTTPPAQAAGPSPKLVSRIQWRRLVGEFMVIVVGVLVALAVDSAAANRQEQRRASEYVTWILTDLRATADPLSAAIRIDEGIDSASAQLLRTLGRSPLPGPDSLIDIFGRLTPTAVLDPLVATVDALVESGDLRLLADPATRLALLKYRAAVTSFEQIRELWAPFMVRGFQDVGTRVCPNFTCGATWSELAKSPAFQSDIFYIGLAARNRTRALRRLSGALDDAIAALEGTPTT